MHRRIDVVVESLAIMQQQQDKNIYDQLSAINPNQACYTVCFEDSDEENDPKDASGTVTDTTNSPVVYNTHGSSKELNVTVTSNGIAGTNSESSLPLNNISSKEPNTKDASGERENIIHKTPNNLNETPSKNYAQSEEKSGKRKCISETDKENCWKRIREDSDTVENGKDENHQTVEKQPTKQDRQANEGSQSEKLVPVDLETVNNTIPHNSQNTDSTILQCYKNLLKTVSEHLNEIIHTFDSNAKEIIKKHLSGTAESRKSWARCLRKKQALFNLSYCTVLNVIIPQKQNESFIGDFVRDSCNLMNAKGRTCTYSKMKQLVTEMIEWTERKSSMKNENNVEGISKTRSNPISDLAITISDDEEENDEKPTILILTEEECGSQQDNEKSQSNQNEDILSNNQQNSAINEKDPLANSEMDVKEKDPLENSALYENDPLFNSAIYEKDPLDNSVNDDKVSLENSSIVEKDPLELDDQSVRSSKTRETVSVDQVYSMLINKEGTPIENSLALCGLTENNLVLNIQESLPRNQNDSMTHGRIQLNPQVPTQDSSMLPTNLVPFEIQHTPTLHRDDSFVPIQQDPSQAFHGSKYGLVPSPSHTVYRYPPATQPSQAPKISVRSEHDLGLSHRDSSAPSHSDPHLLSHQLSAPHFVPYRPPIIYNQTIVNQQNSTVIQHSSLVAQSQFVTPPVNQNHSQASPQYNNLPPNSLPSQIVNQNYPFNVARQQYPTQTSALPHCQQYFNTQLDQLTENQIQENYIARHNPTSQKNTNNKNVNEVRKIMKKTITIPHYPPVDPRHGQPKQSSQIFSSGPPWRQVSINVNSEVLKHSNARRNQITEPNVPQQYLNQISTNQTNTTEHQQNQLNTERTSYQSQQQLSQGRKWYPQSTSTSTAQPLPNSSVAQQQPNIRAPPPPYPNRLRYYFNIPVNIELAKPPEQQIQRANQPNEQMEDIRSVSTDSGIVSPLNFSSTTPPEPVMNDSAAFDNFSPMITHVTSLHPKATYLPIRECYVCKTATRKRCLGCHRLYYCSLLCQKIHWNEHGRECGRTET